MRATAGRLRRRALSTASQPAPRMAPMPSVSTLVAGTGDRSRPRRRGTIACSPRALPPRTTAAWGVGAVSGAAAAAPAGELAGADAGAGALAGDAAGADETGAGAGGGLGGGAKAAACGWAGGASAGVAFGGAGGATT